MDRRNFIGKGLTATVAAGIPAGMAASVPEQQDTTVAGRMRFRDKVVIITGASQEKADQAKALVDGLKRIATAEEMAEAALFLASEDCAYITGTSLLVDGGMMAGL